MATFKELKVWQKAMVLVETVYTLTKSFPKEETYGLTAQMRRAAISIPSNIAEGAARSSKKEYIQFLSIAFASCCELETQSILSKNLHFLSPAKAEEIQAMISEIGRMLNALQKSLRT